MSQSLSITLLAVGAMVVLNVLMVALTIGTKAVRGARGRRTKGSTSKLENALDNSLITGEVHPDLRNLNDRETDRLAGLAAESDLVERYFARLRATAGAKRGPREPRVLRRPGGRTPPDAAPRPPGRDRQGRRREGPRPHRYWGGRRRPRKYAQRPLGPYPAADGREPRAHRRPRGRPARGDAFRATPRARRRCWRPEYSGT